MLIDGEAPDHSDGIFVMMNKPLGYVCSHDEGPRIYDLLPEQWSIEIPYRLQLDALIKTLPV